MTMDEIFRIISLPLVVGLLLLFVPERFRNIKGIISLLTIIYSCFLSLALYRSGDHVYNPRDLSFESGIDIFGINISDGFLGHVSFHIDYLSGLIIIFTSLLALLICLFSIIYIKKNTVRNYFPYFLITLGCSYGALLAENLLLFIAFWGALGLTLYKLIPGNDEESSATAKKTLILIGASDSIMLAGIAILWKMTGSFNMAEISVPVDTTLATVAFLALLVGSLTKAGAFPFHTWVPDYAKDAPASSAAYLPASLDKLLGIYLLARLTTGLFETNQWIRLMLLSLGVISIISAVMMALVQHNYKKLLGYHAVSQVGYMILGFGLGSIIGVAAGLFHMINNVLYKSGLFLSAGSVEQVTGKDNIEDLGGLSRSMPITFITALVFAMSISGVPPFNGFASKWMIYQSIIEYGNGPDFASRLWILWLGLAVIGSALTLASFIKLIGGIFLGRSRADLAKAKEVPPLMWLPMAVIAVLCTVFGIFATQWVVPGLFMKITGPFEYTGFWNSSFVSLLVLISIILGIIVYLATDIKKFRREDSFIGGEKMQDQTGYPTPEFYKTIFEFRFFRNVFEMAEKKWFDIYDLSKKSVLWLSHVFSDAHTGILTGYVIWAFAGLIIMLLILT